MYTTAVASLLVRLAAVLIASLACFTCTPSPPDGRTAIDQFLLAIRKGQQQTDSELSEILDSFLAQQRWIGTHNETFINSLVSMIDANRRINLVRKEMEKLEKELENADGESAMEYYSPRLEIGTLQASLSLYGVTFEASRLLGEAALELPDVINKAAATGKALRDHRSSWFSGGDALKETILGLDRLRTGNQQALEVLEVGALAILGQNKQDLAAMSDVCKAMGDLVKWSSERSTPKGGDIQSFAQWTLETLKPAVTLIHDHSKVLAQLPGQLVAEKDILEDVAIPLNDLLKEIELLQNSRSH